MRVSHLVTGSRSPDWQGWPRGRRSTGPWASARCACNDHTGSSGRHPEGDQGHPSPASCAFGMPLNLVTSTPFSVNDILRLEPEQIDPHFLRLREARGSPESFQCQRLVPEPQKSEVHSTCSARGGNRRQHESGSPGGPPETVAEMDSERVEEPRKYARSGLGFYGRILAVMITTSWRVGPRRISWSFWL